jgi:hypothetical protein
LNLSLPFRYDFDLKTGKSETGLRTCTYPVEVRDDDGVENVYMEAPTEGSSWRLVEFRPVSEGRRLPFLAANDN